MCSFVASPVQSSQLRALRNSHVRTSWSWPQCSCVGKWREILIPVSRHSRAILSAQKRGVHVGPTMLHVCPWAGLHGSCWPAGHHILSQYSAKQVPNDFVRSVGDCAEELGHFQGAQGVNCGCHGQVQLEAEYSPPSSIQTTRCLEVAKFFKIQNPIYEHN